MRRKWRHAAGAALLGALAGCSTLELAPHGDARTELNRSRRLWQQQALEDYDLTLRRICFCPPLVTDPVVLRVRGGRVVALNYRESGEPVDPDYHSLWPTVPGLFDVVQDAADRRAHRVDVSYDRRLGFPTSINIDYQSNMADEEVAFAVLDLEPAR